ncbi:unnamed protein product [Sphagnum jensenii]|uniref:Uncharacterized protein n=1 Tax=Sphagnum jensenii TaxID=128206 RepID=A0ABP1BKQ9_9BRYO
MGETVGRGKFWGDWQVGESQSVFVRFGGAYELRILVPRKRLRTFWKSDVLERKETESEKKQQNKIKNKKKDREEMEGEETGSRTGRCMVLKDEKQWGVFL